MISDKFNTQGFTGCFWEIEYDGNKGYVLGSIHLASDHLLDPEGKIMKCFKESQSLALESIVLGTGNDEAIREKQLEEVDNQLNQLDQDDKARLARNTLIVLNAIGCEVLINDSVDDKSTINTNILQLINFIYLRTLKGVNKNGMESKLGSLAKARNLLIYELENSKDSQRECVVYFFKGFLAELSKNEITDPSKPKNFPEMLDEEINKEYQEMKAGLEKAGAFENWKIGNLEYFEIYNRRGVPPGFPKEQTDWQRLMTIV